MVLNNLPKHWQVKKLGDIAKWGSGGTPTSTNSAYYGGNIPWIIIGDLNDSYITTSEKSITDLGLKNSSAKIVKPNSVLVAMYGSIGKLGINKIHVATNQAIAFTDQLNDQINNKYLFHFLYHNRSKLHSLGKGGTQKNISQTVLKQVLIPVPPLSEQLSIVSKIEELLSDLENGKQQLQLAGQQLKVYRQSLLKAAFEGKLTAVRTGCDLSLKDGELPKGWRMVKTGEIIETINNGYTPTKEYLAEGSGEIPFIKVYNLNFDGTLNFRKNPTFIPYSIHNKELKRSICFPNDVLINIVGPPLGKVSIVSNQYPEWNINQAIVLFRPNEKILSKYISYFLQNPVTINWLEDTSKATAGQWNVKVSTCRLIPIPIPPIKEQQHIIDELESKLTVCDKIEEAITNSLQQAETLRQCILKKAFEGKLVRTGRDLSEWEKGV